MREDDRGVVTPGEEWAGGWRRAREVEKLRHQIVCEKQAEWRGNGKGSVGQYLCWGRCEEVTDQESHAERLSVSC